MGLGLHAIQYIYNGYFYNKHPVRKCMQQPEPPAVPLSLNKLFTAFDTHLQAAESQRDRSACGPKTAIEQHMAGYVQFEQMNGLRRVQMCRKALDALDKRGWERSFHQRLFHEEYLKSCARYIGMCFLR